MTIKEFESKLEKVGLRKKEFADLVQMSYSGVLNWNSPKFKIPSWVDSWLDLYSEHLECEQLKKAIRESGICKKFVEDTQNQDE